VIDVGSGGGLPGIVLALAREDLEVTLLEATQKKVRFLEETKAALSIGNLAVLAGRAEELGTERSQREVWDVAISRAVASLPVVLEYSATFVMVGGATVAMKAQISEEELAAGRTAGKELGLVLDEVKLVDLPGSKEDIQRQLLVFEKVAETPASYPRRVGLAKKRPLGGLVR